MTTMYTAELDYSVTNPTETYLGAVLDALSSFHPAIGSIPGGISVRVTYAAEDARAAYSVAFDVVTNAVNRRASAGAGTMPHRVEVMTEAEADAREGFVTMPELLSAAEAAELLAVSRVRVNQMIGEGKFRTAQKVGSTYVLARSEVLARLAPVDGYDAAIGAKYDPTI